MAKPCQPEEQLTLSDFHVLDEIFRSAAGAVFKVRRKKNRQLCVLKERKFAELGRKRDILNEVALLERLDHPNVIKCYGHFWDHTSGALYMVLEYADAGDLYSHVLPRRMKGEYYDEGTIWVMFYQLCLGLNHLHSNGVIHRDIKSLNIMMCKDGMVKIGDLGVSRQVGQETMMLQTFYGTPLYASPELCENKPYNEKTDIWSLGVVLYEIACLTPPFSGQNLIALADNIKNARYPSIPKKMFSDSLTRMVAMLLQKNYQKRPSIKQILSWFKEPPVHIPKNTQSRFTDGQDDDERMQQMREDRRRKKKEYEILQKKLREQQERKTEQKEIEKEKRGDARGLRGNETDDEENETKSELSSSRVARDLSGRGDLESEENDEMFFEPAKAEEGGRKHRPLTTNENRGSRANARTTPRVPETEMSTQQIITNRQKIENDIKRKKLQLRNMKKLLNHADFYGKDKGPKKSSKHPLMKPIGSNPKQVEALKKNIIELEMQLMGRQAAPSDSNDTAAGFDEAWSPRANGTNINNTHQQQANQVYQRNDNEQGRHNNYQNKPQRAGPTQPVIAIPDTPDSQCAGGPPSNEREARLRKRMTERLARQKESMYEGARSSRSQARPTTSIHHKNTGNVKQIYVNKAAARGAWGEHGLGLPGLAKDMDNNNARNKLREEQERERVREGRAREERARRVREKKILEQKNRRREEKERAREMAVKPNFTFMPPKAVGDNIDLEEEKDEVERNSLAAEAKKKKEEEEEEKRRKEAFQEDEGHLSDDSLGDERQGKKENQISVRGRSARLATAFSPQPERRRTMARKPVNLHAQSMPRQNGAHNLFKVYSPPREKDLPGNKRDKKQRPLTAGVSSRPLTSARKYNFINQEWQG